MNDERRRRTQLEVAVEAMIIDFANPTKPMSSRLVADDIVALVERVLVEGGELPSEMVAVDHGGKRVQVGDLVTPDTLAGVWLADVPVDGKRDQLRNSTSVFRGVGEVIDMSRVEIDYDSWGGLYVGTGVLEYISLKVRTETGESGWVGAGAVNVVDQKGSGCEDLPSR